MNYMDGLATRGSNLQTRSIRQKPAKRINENGEYSVTGEHAITCLPVKPAEQLQVADIAICAANFSLPEQESVWIVARRGQGQLYVVQVGAEALKGLSGADDIEERLL